MVADILRQPFIHAQLGFGGPLTSGDHQVGSRESALSRGSDDSLVDGAMDGRLMDDGVVGQSKNEDGEETFSCDVSRAFHVSTQILEPKGHPNLPF